MTTDKSNRAAPAPTPTRKSPDKWTLAAKLGRRLEQLRRDTDAELLKTPQAIEAKYEAKRKALLGEASAEVLDALPAGVLRDDEKR